MAAPAALFGPVTVAIVALVISRDDLRARLRRARTARLPLMGEGTAMIAAYLGAERDRGRIAASADIPTLAPTLIGAGHLIVTDRESPAPDEGSVHKMVTAVLAGAM